MENDSNNHESHKTPPKFIDNLPLDILEAVKHKNQPQGSPFYCLPNHTTPPSRFLKIKNPFEAAINERLHAHIFSPSVFAKVDNRKSIDKFKWTIEDVSSLRPAHIDESTIAQFEQSNPEDEVIVQQKIERFFSETHIVPSPWNEDLKTVPLISESSPSASEIKDVCESWTQTELSLPPVLPEELEKALRPFFSFTQSQKRDTIDMSSSLYRKLFHFNDDSVVSLASSSVHGELSDVAEFSVEYSSEEKRRNFDSPDAGVPTPPEISPITSTSPKELNNCEISPILRKNNCTIQERDASFETQNLNVVSTHSDTKFSPRFNFSSHMSVDVSLNMVPENDLQSHNDSLNSESPLRSTEFMETSFDWDIEYNSVSFDSKSTRRNLFEVKDPQSEAMMDISNVATPKLPSKSSQRKNLSNSFKEESSIETDRTKFRKINLFEENKLAQRTEDSGYNTINNINKQDVTDAKDDEDIVIFASTPTKS